MVSTYAGEDAQQSWFVTAESHEHAAQKFSDDARWRGEQGKWLLGIHRADRDRTWGHREMWAEVKSVTVATSGAA